MSGQAMPIPLSRLNPNPDYQPRGNGLSEAHVQLLIEAGAEQWPPLLVSPDDSGGYDVIDGFHRHEAARRLGLTVLPCVVAPGAGYPDAVTANLAHGLPLGLADRKDFARWLAEQHPNWSYREIGRRSGLSDKTAKRAIEADSSVTQPRSQPPDPLRRLVRLAYQAYQARRGRTLLGFGKAGNPTTFRRLIDAYPEDEREDVATALTAFGHACVEAAGPYLSDDERSSPCLTTWFRTINTARGVDRSR